MIFYFSGTGNSEYVAREIAKKTGDTLISIGKTLPTHKRTFIAAKGENVGFVMPVYFYGVPTAVLDFLEDIFIDYYGHNYGFVVLTCGGTTANAGRRAINALNGRRIHTDAIFSVRMVDNYIPMYDISNEEQAKKKLEKAEPWVQKIVEGVCRKDKGDFDKIKGKTYMSKVLYPLYKPFRKTKKFYATDACTGCGKCARDCPCTAIKIEGKKPVWVKPECTQCLRCIHTCPQKAIEFGKSTAGRNRYYNPYV